MPKRRSPGDGGLYYIKSRDLWRGVVDLDPVDGKRRQKSVTARTQRACRQKLEDLREEIRLHGAPMDKTSTLSDWADKWLEEITKPEVDPNTFITYASLVRLWIVPTIGHRRVSEVKPADVRAVRERITDAGRSPSTARQAYTVLSRMLEAARREGLCARNVAEDVNRPKNTPVHERDALSTADAVKILETAATRPDGAMWWFKILTGPRQSEILGATLDSLDLDAGYYTVDWALSQVPRDHGCGQAVAGTYPCGYSRGALCPKAKWRIPNGFEMRHLAGRLCLIRPKSRTGRVIPLIPQMVEAFSRHLAATADLPNPHGLIWRNRDGSPIIPRQDAQAWRELLHASGLITADQLSPASGAVTGHTARHTTVTILAELGVDFQLIGQIVGHGSEEVTRIYRHARAEEGRAAMGRLGDVLVGKREIEQ